MTKVNATCPACQKRFMVSPQMIGKNGRCSSCQKVFVLRTNDPLPKDVVRQQKLASEPKTRQPASKTQPKQPPKPSHQRTAAATPSGLPPSPARLKRPPNAVAMDLGQNAHAKIKNLHPLLEGKRVKTGRVSILYRINILFTSFVMLLLPIIYLCMIAAVCYLVYYHAINSTGIFSAVRGRAIIFAGLAYIAPILGGVVLVFFMLKPLLARQGGGQRRRKINPKGEPVLFWFVESICKSVGAPVPRQIYITHDINASASFENGLRGALFGRNLTLHIGVPLVAGLNLQQFGGVLAHEFGHFSQGAGMRLSTFIRGINFWFARVVYERDAWDEGLASIIDEDTDYRISLLVLFAQLCVFLSRGFLWLLMWFGHMVSCLLLRQMEFDADKYEIQFAGSENFQQTSDQLQILNASYSVIIPSIINAAIAKKTVKNLPKSIAEKAKSLEPAVIEEILHASHSSQTGMFDSHPSDGQRIAKAKGYAAEGVFHCPAPASVLFSNFGITCESITDDFYRNEFGVTKQMIRKPNRGRR